MKIHENVFRRQLAAQIKAIVKSKGLTYRKIAEDLGMNEKALSAGINRNMTLTRLVMLANYLDCEVKITFERDV